MGCCLLPPTSSSTKSKSSSKPASDGPNYSSVNNTSSNNISSHQQAPSQASDAQPPKQFPFDQRVERNISYEQVSPEEWKNRGNALFQKREYVEALFAYNRAIEGSPKTSIYFSNRARCYKMRKLYSLAIQDCQEALSLDPHNLKGLVLYAECLINTGKLNQKAEPIKMGIAKLGEALFLSKEKASFQYASNAIRSKFEKANHILHFIERMQNLSSANDLQKTLQGLIKADSQSDEIEKESFLALIDSRLNSYQLERRESINRKEVNIPQALTCPITQELMQRPVVARTSGVSFEREFLLAHVNRDPSDPVSREELHPEDIIENVQLQRYCEDYEVHNPLARELFLTKDVLDEDM